jgi:hypothetical protein
LRPVRREGRTDKEDRQKTKELHREIRRKKEKHRDRMVKEAR